MSNAFSGFSTEGMEAPKDTLGGFSLFNSGLYEAVIKLAYLGKSANSEAQSITFHFDIGGRDFRSTQWVTNKANQNYSEKDGVKKPMLGYVIADDICLLATGYALPQQTMEEKTVPLYDFDAKENRPQNVKVITSILEKKVILGIHNAEVDVTKKNESTGKYDPTGETKNENQIDKVFHADAKKTTAEFREGKEAAFYDMWDAKWTGKINERAKHKGKGGQAGRPGQAVRPVQGGGASGSTQGKSLFGN